MIWDMLKSVLLGVVEGITEWLPISSTGHMILVNEFINNTGFTSSDLYLYVIQLGAILAVVTLYFHKLNPFSPSKTAAEKKDTWSMWFKVITACLPAAVIGLLLDNFMEHFENWQVVSAMLILYGIAFIIIEKNDNETWPIWIKVVISCVSTAVIVLIFDDYMLNWYSIVFVPVFYAIWFIAFEWIKKHIKKQKKINTINEMSYKTAFGIGMFQVLSIIPGTSRSGATILGAIILGCSRETAAEFSFFLAIPVMFGVSLLKIVKTGLGMTGNELIVLITGMIVAYAVSMLAIKFLVSYVRRHDFTGFGYYRIALGLLVIIYFSFIAA